MKRMYTRRLFLCLLLAACASVEMVARPRPQAAAPECLKIEPPNWWVGHSINPVRVMIRGRNLAGARVEGPDAGLTVSHLRSNPAGTYVFVDLAIRPGAKPGRRLLRIITPYGQAVAPFDVLAAPSRAARFQGFSPDDVIYLLMPDRFSDGDLSNDDPRNGHGVFDRNKSRFYHGGDFRGIINHLPYLKDLGVTAIWMTPIYANADQAKTVGQEAWTDYHGYAAVDFYGVEEHFGSMAELRTLVEAAHQLGIKVIQDEVANHTGPDHPWVKDPPTPTWFNGTAGSHLDETWQTWSLMDPHSTPAIRRSTLEGWFANVLPDLNQNDEEVSRYLIQNTLWWIGMAGFDGIREDTLPYVPRRFWRDWMTAIKREYPKMTVVGEVLDGDPALTSFFQGGVMRFDGIDTRIDTVFDYPLFYAVRRAFGQGKSIQDVGVTLSHDYLYPDASQLVAFIGNHDVERFMNEPGATAAGLELADTFLMTARGIPVIYYGDEIAMPGGNDPDNRRDFPGGWPGDAQNAFVASGRSADPQAVFEHLRRLAHLRAELEPLRQGSMVNLEVDEQTYAYARVTPRQSVVVVINNSPKEEPVEFGVREIHLADGTMLEDRLGVTHDLRVEDAKISVHLPARTAGLYVVKSPRENSHR